MIQPSAIKSVGISERKSLPLLTGLLAMLALFTFYNYQSAHSTVWVTENTIRASRVIDLLAQQKFGDLARLFYISNFLTTSLGQLGASVYFLCLFGIPVEKRLAPGRFLLLVCVAAVLPWCVQIFDAWRAPVWPIPFEHEKSTVSFFGLTSIILALAGAYLVLVPKKEKDPTQSRLYRKDRAEIFNRGQAKPMTEKFGLSPNVFFAAFIVAVIVQHYCLILLTKDYDSIGLFAGLISLGIGYATASFISIGIEDTFQEHPLKHAAVKKYYELMDLDVSHDNAIKGSAKSLGLPDYQVEGWVKKNKGKLRPN